MANQAAFTVDGLPSEDVDGNRGVVVSNGATVTLQLEVIPSGALSATFQLFDATDNTSPLASLNAPALVFDGSGTALELLTDPDNETSTFTFAASGINAYLVRCTVSTSQGPIVFERCVVSRGTNSGLRKTFPAESQEFEARGWSDELNRMVETIESIASGGNGNLQTAYNFGAFGGTVIVTVDGTNDLNFDTATPHQLGIDLFAIRQNIGGGEQTNLFAPDTDDDVTIAGTDIAVFSSGGSDQVTADTGQSGTTAGSASFGAFFSGGSGSDSGGTSVGGSGGAGGAASLISSLGGDGGAGSGVFAAGTGGNGGDAQITAFGGGFGGEGTASVPGAQGGTGGSIIIGQSVASGDGGDSTDASQASGQGGAGGAGILLSALGGGNAGAAAGGVGNNGGTGAPIQMTGGDGGTATGSGTDGTGGNVELDPGDSGATPGQILISTKVGVNIVSGVGNAEPLTRWTHGGDFAIDNEGPTIILVNQNFGTEDAKRWMIQAQNPDAPPRFMIGAAQVGETITGPILRSDRLVSTGSVEINQTALLANQILFESSNSTSGLTPGVLIRPQFAGGTGDLAELLTLSSRGGANNADVAFHVGTRDPNGNVTGNPGDYYYRADAGTSSTTYQHQGAAASNSDWVEFGGGVSDLQSAYNGGQAVDMVLATGNVTWNATDAVSWAIQKAASNVIAMSTAGAVAITPTSGQNLDLTAAGTGIATLAAVGTGDTIVNSQGGVIRLQEGGVDRLTITAAGAVNVDLASAEDFTVTTTSGGNAVINAYTFPDLNVDTFSFPDTNGPVGNVLTDLLGDGVYTAELSPNNLSASAGVTTGFAVTFNVDTTLYDVASGTVLRYDTANPPNVPVPLDVPERLGEAMLNPSTDSVTFLSIDSTNGDLVKRNTRPTNTEKKTDIPIQEVTTIDGVNVASISNNQQPAFGVAVDCANYLQKLGRLNEGNQYTNASTDASLQKSAGVTTGLYFNGLNAFDRITQDDDAVSPVGFAQIFRDSTQPSGFNVSFQTQVPFGFYDNNDDFLVAVGMNDWAIYWCDFNNGTAVTVGQATYNTLSEAEAAVTTENPVTIDIVADVRNTRRTAVIARGGGGNFSLPADVKFVILEAMIGSSSSAVLSVNGQVGITLLGMQEVYDQGQGIEIGALGPLALTNSTTTDDLLSLTRTSPGLGSSLVVGMGLGNEAVTDIGVEVSSGTAATGTMVHIDNLGSGDALDVRDGGVSAFQVTGAGRVQADPTSGQDFAVTVQGVGNANIISTGSGNIGIDAQGGAVNIDADDTIFIDADGAARFVSATDSVTVGGDTGFSFEVSATPVIAADLNGALDLTPPTGEDVTITTLALGNLALNGGVTFDSSGNLDMNAQTITNAAIATRTITGDDSIVDSDMGLVLLVDSATAVELTLNNGRVAGFNTMIRQVGLGQAKVIGTAQLRNSNNHDATREQYSKIGIEFIATDEYGVDGDSTVGT